MKKVLLIAVASLALVATAHAQETMGGLGFRSLDNAALRHLENSNNVTLSGGLFGAAPSIGVRQWFTEQIGVDAAVGFISVTTKHDAPTPSQDLDEMSGFAIDLGVPFSAKRWEKVNFIVRPGFMYGSATSKDKALPAGVLPTEFKETMIAVSGELEVEWMVADKLSISASHGISYVNAKFEDNDSGANKTEQSFTGFATDGAGFTQLGFHVYLW